MTHSSRLVLQTLLPMWLFLTCVLGQLSCTCAPARLAKSTNSTIECIAQYDDTLPIAPAQESKLIVAGRTEVQFDATDGVLRIRFAGVPGRGPEPDLHLSLSSSGGESLVGVGASLHGASAITRCNKSIAMDGENAPVMYNADDAFCLDDARMVVVAKNETTTEYRTWPDSQLRIVAQLGADGPEYFEVFFPSGSILELGKTPETRPLATGNVPRAWLAGKMTDPRGSFMTYGYCFAERDGYTAEYALTRILYSGFEGMEPTRAVALVHSVKDAEDVRTVYSRGMAFQESLRLDELKMHGPGNTLVRRYELGYEQSETTGRTRLTSVQECGASECTAPTLFYYGKTERGFQQVTTTMDAPLSSRASPMMADFNGDGIDDLLVGDTTAISTPTTPITEWKMFRNAGGGFTAPKVAFLQEWSFAEDAQGECFGGNRCKQ